jgi:hypothetical protein
MRSLPSLPPSNETSGRSAVWLPEVDGRDEHGYPRCSVTVIPTHTGGDRWLPRQSVLDPPGGAAPLRESSSASTTRSIISQTI